MLWKCFMNIVCIPLDKRPYNYAFLQSLAALSDDLKLYLPETKYLGFRKNTGDRSYLTEFLDICPNPDAFVISVEMLIYGGLFPSRIHTFSKNELIARLEIFHLLRKKYPKAKIYVSNLILRNPSYSSSEEEPLYYAEHGSDIFRWGYLQDKISQNKAESSEITEFEALYRRIHHPSLDDYRLRRSCNLAVTHKIVQLAQNKVIDLLFIPRDDTAEFGLASIDRCQVMSWISSYTNIYSHPGTDEAMMTLMVRACADYFQKSLRIFPLYADSKDFIPKYEDIPFSESLTRQTLLIGGELVANVASADVVLALHTPYTEIMEEALTQKSSPSHQYRNNTFINTLSAYTHKAIIIADIAYTNGGDTDLITALDQTGLLSNCAGYAAWNTTGNTLGTCLAAAYFSSNTPYLSLLKTFMAERILSDWAYQAHVRWEIEKKVLPTIGASYSNFNGKDKFIMEAVREAVCLFVSQNLKKTLLDVDISSLQVSSPFQRMSGLHFQLKPKSN